MTENETIETLTENFLSFLINYFATEFNYELMQKFIQPIIKGSMLYPNSKVANFLNLDNDETKILDFIGEKIVGIDRSAPVRIIGGESIDYLNNDEYKTILKYALSSKDNKISFPDIQNSLNSIFTTGAYVKENKWSLYYIFDDDKVDTFLLNLILDKNLLIKPTGVRVYIFIKPSADKFFNFPVGRIDGVDVYNIYEDNKGLIYGGNI